LLPVRLRLALPLLLARLLRELPRLRQILLPVA
jgi:hypothetical protein